MINDYIKISEWNAIRLRTKVEHDLKESIKFYLSCVENNINPVGVCVLLREDLALLYALRGKK